MIKKHMQGSILHKSSLSQKQNYKDRESRNKGKAYQDQNFYINKLKVEHECKPQIVTNAFPSFGLRERKYSQNSQAKANSPYFFKQNQKDCSQDSPRWGLNSKLQDIEHERSLNINSINSKLQNMLKRLDVQQIEQDYDKNRLKMRKESDGKRVKTEYYEANIYQKQNYKSFYDVYDKNYSPMNQSPSPMNYSQSPISYSPYPMHKAYEEINYFKAKTQQKPECNYFKAQEPKKVLKIAFENRNCYSNFDQRVDNIRRKYQHTRKSINTLPSQDVVKIQVKKEQFGFQNDPKQLRNKQNIDGNYRQNGCLKIRKQSNKYLQKLPCSTLDIDFMSKNKPKHDTFADFDRDNTEKQIIIKGRNINTEINSLQAKINEYTLLKKKMFEGNEQRAQLKRSTICSNSNGNQRQINNFVKEKQKEYPHFVNPFEIYQKQEQIFQEQKQNQNSSLINDFIQQIKLDQRFRNAKKWFDRLNSAYKWIQLSKILKQKSVRLDQFSIKDIFSIQSEEDNPFYTARQNQFTIYSLVQSFIECQQGWFNNIVKRHKRKDIEMLGLAKIALKSSREIQLENLVSFINTESDGQYRNRDLCLIFQRLKSEEILTLNNMLEVICFD